MWPNRTTRSGPVRRTDRRGRGGPLRRDLAVYPLARDRGWNPEVRRAVLTYTACVVSVC